MGLWRFYQHLLKKKRGVGFILIVLYCAISLVRQEVLFVSKPMSRFKPFIDISIFMRNNMAYETEMFYLSLDSVMLPEEVTNISHVNNRTKITTPTPPIIGNSYINKLRLGKKINAKGRSYWRNLIIDRKFTASEKDRLFILGSVAKNSSKDAQWDTFVIYGQWYQRYRKTSDDVKCCFIFDDGHIAEESLSSYTNQNEFNHFMYGAKLTLFHITCRKPNYRGHVTKMSIMRDYNCSSSHVKYVRPFYTKLLPDNHITITTKLAYLKVDMETMYSFLETARHIGINKVITYVHESLQVKFRPVLLYYASIGLLEYHAIELADTERVPRLKSLQVLDNQYMHDEWIVKKDALERSMGSTFFGIFDMDEFLVPSRNRTLKQMLLDIFQTFPKASHFFFTTLHFLTDHTSPNLTCGTECSMFERHVYMSPQKYNGIHEKMILMTSRVVTQTINNHYIVSHSGYTRFTCPPEEGVVVHYGSCIRKFTKLVCKDRESWISDDFMVSWSNQSIRQNIKKSIKTVKRIFNTT